MRYIASLLCWIPLLVFHTTGSCWTELIASDIVLCALLPSYMTMKEYKYKYKYKYKYRYKDTRSSKKNVGQSWLHLILLRGLNWLLSTNIFPTLTHWERKIVLGAWVSVKFLLHYMLICSRKKRYRVGGLPQTASFP